MADWRRMEWQWRANVYAEIARIICVLLLTDEVGFALRYHFPLWDDIATILTVAVMQASWFIDRHTRMYRWDL